MIKFIQNDIVTMEQYAGNMAKLIRKLSPDGTEDPIWEALGISGRITDHFMEIYESQMTLYNRVWKPGMHIKFTDDIVAMSCIEIHTKDCYGTIVNHADKKDDWEGLTSRVLIDKPYWDYSEPKPGQITALILNNATLCKVCELIEIKPTDEDENQGGIENESE